jgi:hypothetical protein
MALQESKRFPKSYGDFALQSSDGVICYFPKQILTYMSPALDRWLLDPSVDDKERTQALLDGVLVLEETSAVLEAFLAHIDPKTLDTYALFDVATIAETLAVAEKYEVDIILQRFENEITGSRTEVGRKGTQVTSVPKRSALLCSNPLLILYLGETYGLPKVAQEACRMLAGCSSSLIKPDMLEDKLNYYSYYYVTKLREDRVRRYKGYIEHLAVYKAESSAPARTQVGVPIIALARTPTSTAMTALVAASRASRGVQAAGQGQSVMVRPHNNFKTMGPVLSQEKKVCIDCPSGRAQWILALYEAVNDRPCWESFWAACMKGNRCNKCKSSWIDSFRNDITKWKQESVDLEAQLPIWPVPPTSNRAK